MKLIEIVVLMGAHCVSPVQHTNSATEAAKVQCAVVIEKDTQAGTLRIVPAGASREPEVVAVLNRLDTPALGPTIAAAAPATTTAQGAPGSDVVLQRAKLVQAPVQQRAAPASQPAPAPTNVQARAFIKVAVAAPPAAAAPSSSRYAPCLFFGLMCKVCVRVNRVFRFRVRLFFSRFGVFSLCIRWSRFLCAYILPSIPQFG